MDVLLSSHSHYISLKHNLPRGHLFQGRFGKTLIESEASLLQVSRYIHLNPIKEQLLKMDLTYQKSRSLRNKQLIKDLQNYPWSSYPFYLSNLKGNNLVSINPSYIFSLEKTPTRYRKFVEARMSDEDFHNLENLGSN